MFDLCKPTDEEIALFSLENIKLVCLMPTYNKQDTIAKAIESVMMQKADFAYKLVVLDDCSSDDSYAIAQEYKKRYPDKIEIVRNETNLKLLKNITNGYSLLKGVDYFCVLDADDYYIYDKKFTDAVGFLESHKDYVIYMANVILLKNGVKMPYSRVKKDFIDFDWSDYINEKSILMQSSGIVYRNIYFKHGLDGAFLKGTKQGYGYALRCDAFMLPYHLSGGKAHFVNNLESVYNYNGYGIWSGLQSFKQNLLQALLYIALSEFFPNDKDFFSKKTKKLYDLAIEELRHIDEHITTKNKDLIFYIYSQTYLSNNPIFYNEGLEKLDLTIVQQIFSIKNTPNKRYKVLTILGITFKFKRKAK